MAQMGYLHFLSALNRCSSSSCNNAGSEQMVFALWYRVPATLYFDGMLWWLSHCRYRSVCVCFLNTDVFKLPSSVGVIRMSRNGIAIKEAILIRVNDPSLNRNIGKYHLPHIWDDVLHKTSELKLKH